MLLRQRVARACSFVLLRAGRRMAAKAAMMDITTSNSTSVKPREPSGRRAHGLRVGWDDSRIVNFCVVVSLGLQAINTSTPKIKQAFLFTLLDGSLPQNR